MGVNLARSIAYLLKII